MQILHILQSPSQVFILYVFFLLSKNLFILSIFFLSKLKNLLLKLIFLLLLLITKFLLVIFSFLIFVLCVYGYNIFMKDRDHRVYSATEMMGSANLDSIIQERMNTIRTPNLISQQFGSRRAGGSRTGGLSKGGGLR